MPRISRTSRAVAPLLVALVSTLASGIEHAQAQAFLRLDHLPFMGTSPMGISADGSTVVGYSSADVVMIPLRWSADGTPTELEVLDPGAWAYADAISGDGSWIVGIANDGTTNQAVRWDQNNEIDVLQSLGREAFATGVNFDGSIIVGHSSDSSIYYQAVRWDSAGNIEVLEALEAGAESRAEDVTADGAMIVGYAVLNDEYQAVRWGLDGLVTVLAPVGAGDSYAYAVTDDGSFTVGASADQAVWWDAASVSTILPHFAAGTFSVANDVSEDGSVIVGRTELVAVRWTDAGVVSIKQLLESNGIDMSGWNLVDATAVSADGLTIVGSGDGPEQDGRTDAWIMRAAGFTTVSGAAEGLAALGAVGEGAQNFVTGALATSQEYALQHAADAQRFEPLGYAPDPGANFPNIKRDRGSYRFRVFGYAEGFASGDYDGGHGRGQVGASYAPSANTIAGGSLGFGGATTDMAFDGEADFLGVSGSVFAAYVQPTGFQAVFSATAVRYDAEIARGYMNGADTATSDGETAGYGAGAALRVGYAFSAGQALVLTPFASVQAVHVDLDGYTETTGPFPAIVGDIEDTVVVGKIGLEAKHYLAPETWLWASAAWAHRGDGESAAIDAQLIGLFGISGATIVLAQDWAEVTGGVSYGLGDGVSRLSVSATAYIPGGDTSATGRIGYSRAF